MKTTILVLSVISLFSFSISAQTENLSCTDCHATYIQHAVMHPVAADDCETCHMSTGNEHPKDGVKGFDLGDEMPALCFMCHEEHTKENVHAVSTECLMCHSPHGSENKSLLLSSPQSLLCAECHDMSNMEKQVKHKPVADGSCSSCHDPHQSDYPKLLKAEKTQLCLDCHTSVQMESGLENIHPPIDDDCANCHNAHSTDEDKLLNEKMPDLCFMCHEEHTKTNVHAVATECMMCHTPHGSANKSLVISSPQSAICAECHDMSMAEKRVKHKPVADGTCSSCHDPHQSDYTKLLKAEKTQLCLNCHTSVQMESGLENIHAPFDDDCANCHNGHSADEDKLLLQKMPELCYNCHDMQTSLKEAAVDHTVVSEGKTCSNCHSAHASNQRGFLINTEKELCLSCHSKSIKTEERTISNIGQFLKKGNYIHGIIEGDGCIVCHSPHYSDKSLLLNETFPTKQYAAAKTENFEMCFMCHDSDLMTVELTTTATNFRNGEQNMHYLHIKGEKGRNCNLCHNVHGSAFEHLIADKVMFGKWEMPIEYKMDENGGSCNTGCHAKKKYSR